MDLTDNLVASCVLVTMLVEPGTPDPARARPGVGAHVGGVGSALNNSIYGHSGSDTLNGATGVDRLSGFAGNDVYLTDGGDTIGADQPAPAAVWLIPAGGRPAATSTRPANSLHQPPFNVRCQRIQHQPIQLGMDVGARSAAAVLADRIRFPDRFQQFGATFLAFGQKAQMNRAVDIRVRSIRRQRRQPVGDHGCRDRRLDGRD